MQDEKVIVKSSVPIFVGIAVILAIISLWLKNISFVLGFCLGYFINLIIFKITVISVDGILLMRSKVAMSFMAASRLLKTIIYAIGFLIAIKLPNYFNLFTVTLGYFVIKSTIFYREYRIRKRGEVK